MFFKRLSGKYQIILAAVTIIIASIVLIFQSNILERRKPNIILISVDTLRADHLSCYGHKFDTSPNLDEFAAQSLLFKNCISHAPSTAQSCASFLSGFLPHETGVLTNSIRVSPRIPMIAKILKASGYKTYGVVSNYVLRKKQGFGQGFDIYNDRMDNLEEAHQAPERIAENTTDCAVEILKKHAGGKFFMWIHYQDPHGPYTPKSPYDNLFK